MARYSGGTLTQLSNMKHASDITNLERRPEMPSVYSTWARTLEAYSADCAHDRFRQHARGSHPS